MSNRIPIRFQHFESLFFRKKTNKLANQAVDGPAQRIYVKRGYIPDGSGVWYQNKVLDQYAPCVNDDDLLLFLSKSLTCKDENRI